MSTIDKQLILKSLEEELASVEADRTLLEVREEALTQAIDGLRELISLNGGTPAQNRLVVKKDAFKDLSIVQGAIQYLKLVGEPQKNRALVNGLISGGKSGEGDFATTVRSVLIRESAKPNSEIYWSAPNWGLKIWQQEQEEN